VTPHLRLIGATLLASVVGATAFSVLDVWYFGDSLDLALEMLVGFTLVAGFFAISLSYLAWSRRPYAPRTLVAFTASSAVAIGATLSLIIVLAGADHSGFAGVLSAFLVCLAPAALIWWLLLRGALTIVGSLSVPASAP
jgi:hypothetical protein